MPTLRIVTFNDVYSLENLPRLASLIAFHRTTNPTDAFLVTLPGDFLSPSILSSLDFGRGMVDCLNALGVDLVTFGNHEDDLPTEALRARIKELRATWLGTNVQGVEPGVVSSWTLDVGGVRVGFCGVVMNDEAVYRRPPFGGATPANDAALAETARLVAAGCAFVVPLTHQSIDDDRTLARTGRFPVILGGHEHTPFLEQVGESRSWVVKAGSEAEHAVVVDLVIDPAAPAAPRVHVFLDDAAKYPEDPAMRARVDRHMKRVHDLENATLLVLPPGQVVSSVGSRLHQTSVGTLVCTRLRDALLADGCVFNGGGIRAAREHAGRITYGDVKAELPFDNEVVVAKLPGRVLADAVRVSRSHGPEESPSYLQVDDRMKVVDGVLAEIGGAPLDPARDYRIALVRNLFTGLDHIEPLVAWAKANPERVPPAGCGREVKQILIDSFAIELWSRLGGFDAVDTNHDGVVTAEEVLAAVARVNAEAPSPITADLVVRALDANHDHVIDREEGDAKAPPKPEGC